MNSQLDLRGDLSVRRCGVMPNCLGIELTVKKCQKVREKKEERSLENPYECYRHSRTGHAHGSLCVLGRSRDVAAIL